MNLKLLFFIFLFWSGVVNAQDTNELIEQIASVFAEGITKDNVHIVYVLVPDLQITEEVDTTTVEPDNLIEITIAFSIADITVLENLKGEITENIFIENIFSFRESIQYQTFTWEPNSEWILLLESPFDSLHSDFKKNSDKLTKLNAHTFLNQQNFFSVYSNGFGSACVSWPKNLPKGELLPVLPKQIVGDIKIILDRFDKLIKQEKNLESHIEFQKKLNDTFSKSLYKQIIDLNFDE